MMLPFGMFPIDLPRFGSIMAPIGSANWRRAEVTTTHDFVWG